MEDDQIIVDVQMDALIASLQELRQQYDANTEALKKLDKESDDYDKQVIELTQQNKVLQQEMRGVEKQIQNEIKAQRSQEDSLVQLRAKLANLNKQYDSMSGMERMGDAGVELQEKIKSLHDQILGLEGETGRMQRNVGNYPEAVKPVQAQLRELTQQLMQLRAEGKQNSEEYRNLVVEAGRLKDAMADTKREVNQLASDTGTLNTVMDAAKLASGAFSAALGIFNLIGDKDSKTAQELAEAQRKLQAAIAITTGLQAVQNTLQKESALMMGIHKVQIWAAAKAQDEYALATGRATVAQRIFNAVAKSNPYVLLATAILSVVGAIAAFTAGSKEQEKQVRNTNNELKNHLQVLQYLQNEYKSLNSAVEQSQQVWIEYLESTGASIEQIREAEDKLYQTQVDNLKQQRRELGYTIVEVTYYESEYTKALENIKTLEDLRMKAVQEHDEESQIYFENEINRIKRQADHYKGLVDAYANINTQLNTLQTRRNAQLAKREKEDADRERAAAEEQKRRHEERLQRMKEEREALRKQTEELDKYLARLKMVSTFDLSTRQAQAELDEFRKKWEETQKALEAYENELKIWQDAFPKGWGDEMMDKLERQSNPLYNFSQAYKENAEAIMETSSALESSFSSVASMYETMAKDESKSEEERASAARKAKAWAAIQIAANAGTAMAKGIASAVDVGFPAAIPAMATMVAAVLAAIAQAKALAAESHEHGGVIGGKFVGATRGHDDVLMMGKRGELVLNADQQKTLYDIANGNVSTNLAAELAAAIRQMPAPVVEYTELQRFGDNVAILNESQKLK